MSVVRARSNNFFDFGGCGENVDSELYLNTTYNKKPWYKSRLLSILCVAWLMLTICLGIMMTITLLQPQWIGRDRLGVRASFGLYRICSWVRTGNCEGSMDEFSHIPSLAWKSASVLVLLATTTCFLAVFVWTMFCLCFVDRARFGFRICSLLLFTAGILFLAAILIYPAGLEAKEVRTVCSERADSYKLGECKMMWVYWLAISCAVDAFILSSLALLIIVKDDKLLQSKQRSSVILNGGTIELKTGTLGRNTSSI